MDGPSSAAILWRRVAKIATAVTNQAGRPRECEQMVAGGELEKNLMPAPEPLARKMWRRLGFTALGIGLGLIGLILYAMIFAYG
jgi:hypothetical protein